MTKDHARKNSSHDRQVAPPGANVMGLARSSADGLVATNTDDSVSPLIVQPDHARQRSHGLETNTGAPTLSHNIQAHRLGHQMAQHCLHSLGRETLLEERLSGISRGHCLMDVSQRIRQRLGADMISAGRRSDWDRIVSLEAEFSPISDGVRDLSFSFWSFSDSDYDDSYIANHIDRTTHRHHQRAPVFHSGVVPQPHHAQGADSGHTSNDAYHLASFNRALREETILSDPPVGEKAPSCECKSSCDFRKHIEDEQKFMWVCGTGRCMYFSAYNPTGEPWSGIDADHLVLGNLFKQPGQQEVDEFWCAVRNMMAFPDDHTQMLLIGHAPPRKCVCGVSCSIVVCKITGDIFFICAQLRCFYLLFSQRRQQIGDMDVGQICPLGESGIDRYTDLQFITSWFGKSFTKAFWTQLMSTPPDSNFPRGSFQMERGGEYDAFISYRGGAGRLPLYLTVLGLFNLFPAVVWLYVVCPLLMIPLAFVYDLCDVDDPSARQWAIYGNSCDRKSGDRSWFIFRPYAPPIVLLIVFLWHPFMSWAYGHQRFFLDKYC